MRVFISGGCKNGKSYHAQRFAKAQQKSFFYSPKSSYEPCLQSSHEPTPLYYIATMKPVDGEDNERIDRHRKEREGWGFTTLEQPVDIEKVLEKSDHDGVFLLDSLTALLANEMFSAQGIFDSNACNRVAAGLTRVLDQIQNIVIVSDYIYSDAIIYDPLTEEYRKSLAALDRLAAERCDVVLEAVYTQLIVHKGADIYERIKTHIHTI